MVIIYDRDEIFIHIPRTGGMALSYALEQGFVHTIAELSEFRIHATYQELRPQFPTFKFFTIMRSPWDIFMSHYRWCALMHKHNFRNVAHELEDYCHTVISSGFTAGIQYAMKHQRLCRTPGFWRTYAGDGVDVYQYTDEPYMWISARLDIPLDVQIVNQSETNRPPWTQGAIDAIGEFCHDDIARFGYTAPIAG